MKKPIFTTFLICLLIVCNTSSVSAHVDIVNHNADVIYIIDQQEESVQTLIKTGYNGNYTLSWAKEHDYTELEKVKWVDNKKYSSKTKYLIWVSTAYQRLNIFTGSRGNWRLKKTFIIGSGANGRETPAGVWKTLKKNSKGWTTSKYTVKPVVTFINEKYGFHSRLYYPNSSKISDGRIGFPCSHGCIRMYENDIKWFNENIPLGTTVIVY